MTFKMEEVIKTDFLCSQFLAHQTACYNHYNAWHTASAQPNSVK